MQQGTWQRCFEPSWKMEKKCYQMRYIILMRWSMDLKHATLWTQNENTRWGRILSEKQTCWCQCDWNGAFSWNSSQEAKPTISFWICSVKWSCFVVNEQLWDNSVTCDDSWSMLAASEHTDNCSGVPLGAECNVLLRKPAVCAHS